MKAKQIFFLFFSFCCIIGCGKKKSDDISVNEIYNPISALTKPSEAELARMPIITFETTEYDLGKVMQGERLSYTFKFTNTGKSSLIIESAETSCSCSSTAPPKAPIRPGESGEIKVTFDSKSKSGMVYNAVVIAANTYPVHTVLKLNAEVIVP